MPIVPDGVLYAGSVWHVIIRTSLIFKKPINTDGLILCKPIFQSWQAAFSGRIDIIGGRFLRVEA